MTRRTHPGLVGLLYRWLTYNSVGVMGMGVQLVTLVALTEVAGLELLVATALAVETAILHNFVWHERWTWGDRVGPRRNGRWGRLLRFNLVSGTLSITGNVVFTGLYAATLDVHYAVANVMAIASCSLVNFVANDRLVFNRKEPVPMSSTLVTPRLRRVSTAAVGLLFLSSFADGAELKPDTVRAWDTYIELTEQRIARELEDSERFLAQDFDEDAVDLRRAVLEGDVPVTQMETVGANDRSVPIDGGAIHHWRGAVFVPGVTVREVLEHVQTPLQPEDLQEDVLESRVLERDGDWIKVFLKLRRKKFVTVHYNTEHEMRYVRHDDHRASSRSEATKIAQLADVGSSSEHEHPIGDDSGFLWRLNSYWRYVQVDGGVIVECETATLSRSIPGVVRWMVGPMIRSTARESMERTLRSMKERLLADAPEASLGAAG